MLADLSADVIHWYTRTLIAYIRQPNTAVLVQTIFFQNIHLTHMIFEINMRLMTAEFS